MIHGFQQIQEFRFCFIAKNKYEKEKNLVFSIFLFQLSSYFFSRFFMFFSWHLLLHSFKDRPVLTSTLENMEVVISCKGIWKHLKLLFFHQVSKGRVQGSLDVSHTVMSINKKSNRIDLDAGDILYHIKVSMVIKLLLISCKQKSRVLSKLKDKILIFIFKAKSHDLFYIWVTKLQAHRLYKKNEMTHAHSGLLQMLSNTTQTGQAHRNGDVVTMKSLESTWTAPSLQGNKNDSHICCFWLFVSVFVVPEFGRSWKLSGRIGGLTVSQHRREHQGVGLAEAQPQSRHMRSRYCTHSQLEKTRPETKDQRSSTVTNHGCFHPL